MANNEKDNFPIDFELVGIRAAQGFVLGSLYGFGSGSEITTAAGLLTPKKIVVETAVKGSLSSGVMWSVCAGTIIGTAEVLACFREKKDNLNYAGGGLLAGVFGTLLSQQYTLRNLGRKCTGLMALGVVYSHVETQFADFERYRLVTGKEKPFMEKYIQVMLPSFMIDYMKKIGEKDKSNK